MEFISVFNDVLGPVMRGPSSSHTAGAYRIGLMVRDLVGGDPVSAAVTFDPNGSMAPTYRALGVDLAFATGLVGGSMLEDGYFSALERAAERGVHLDFGIAPLNHTDHPNGMQIDVETVAGKSMRLIAEAVGGGGVRIVRMGDWPVELDGKTYELLAEVDGEAAPPAAELLGDVSRQEAAGSVLLSLSSAEAASDAVLSRLRALPGLTDLQTAEPVFFVRVGRTVFESAEEMVTVAEDRGLSLGETALGYETELLGMSEDDAIEEMVSRYEVMEKSVAAGFDDGQSDMLLLQPTASEVFTAVIEGSVAVGGVHARAAARAMAVMHCCNSRGVVCAAPTGGSAGTVPGVVVSLVEEMGLSRRRIALALFAASAVGLIVAKRATFAAEIAGCQVEIGVAGAMAAASVVEAAGGSARQAANAAAISLQNTIGSPCDPVAGTCEVPCHTRNAVAASSAFTCADLILGGYVNPIPLDETIDASYAVGQALPSELRCTARGGCAVAPSALSLQRLR